MLINRNVLLPVLVGISWLTSCKQDDDSIACKPVDNISAPGTCYEPSRGLTLVASGQTSSADRSQFTWSVFPQSDTTLTNDISASREKILVGNGIINIPDSLLKNAPKFIVKVKTTGCGATELHSIHYAFIKRQAAGSTCAVWQRRSI